MSVAPQPSGTAPDPSPPDPTRTDPASLDPELVCSAKGCRASARWSLRWNNPRLHHAERRKIWMACDEHRARLGDFLQVRGFLREVAPLG